ncbi:hypothetical protein [Massilia haematophila]|uniref:Lipoprotein n=1 Tax=Massilia haematophila TaxID=457923 RepID=A0ABV7PJF0_9BURK
MRRSCVIPAAFAVAILAACGRSEGPADRTAGGASASTGQIDYWAMLAPLVAGSHGGDCARLPVSEPLPGAAITLGRDGRLTAPGIDVDMRRAQMIQLGREVRDGAVQVSAMLSIDAADGPVLSLVDEGTPDGAAATLMRNASQISCARGSPLDKLRGQPLYKAAAGVIEGAARTLKCGSMKTRMAWTNTEFKVVDGILTLGAETFDLRRADRETLMFTAEESQLAYSFSLPGGPLMYVFYDAAGRVRSVEGRTEVETTHACHTDV